jgi:hypothetical protein
MISLGSVETLVTRSSGKAGRPIFYDTDFLTINEPTGEKKP